MQLVPLALPAVPMTLALMLLACGAQPASPPVCGGPDACRPEQSCIVGRCRPKGSRVAAPDARRIFVVPRRVAVLASRGSSGGGSTLPESVSLGGQRAGDVVLLLGFAMDLKDGEDVASAFVVLSPLAFAPPPAGPTAIEVGRILEPWNPETVSWGRRPRLGPLEQAALLRPLPARPSRIDVTSLVRNWSHRRSDDHGIALLASGSDPFGATYTMGLTEGTGPVLEVYLQ